MKTFITTEIFIERAKQVHGSKFDYSETIYQGLSKKNNNYL